jgi:hypothetical protein
MKLALSVMLLPLIGDMGWVDAPTHTCLYKAPNSAQIFFVETKKDQPCPERVEFKQQQKKPPKDA